MKISELRAKSDEQLREQYQELTNELRDQNFKLAIDQLKSVRDVRKKKKEIAKIFTILKERKAK
ncbi:MAG TPA: 50S ribosomal protein L29 [Candidatus Bipolaricaulota bacterium]|nr:50S ribosomal protein L29 [Candidatus Bipolaricaulota bacterium]